MLTLINCDIVFDEGILMDIQRVCQNRQNNVKLTIHRFDKFVDQMEQSTVNDDNEHFKIVNYFIDE